MHDELSSPAVLVMEDIIDIEEIQVQWSVAVKSDNLAYIELDINNL